MGRLLLFLIIPSLVALSFLSEVQSASFKIVNKCRHTIWPGLLSGATSPPLPTTGFTLESGKSRTIKIPKSWSGRIWARTLCGQDSDGKFSCATADCGSGKVECVGGAKPPATLAEFTLNGADGLDFYDVSLVDGYNLPMLIVAKDGIRGGCSATGCLVDLNGGCPAELRVARSNGSRGSVACRSACEAFGDPRFCCSEAYSTPDTQKLLGARKDGAQLPLVNKTMMYLSRLQSGGSSPSGEDKYSRVNLLTLLRISNNGVSVWHKKKRRETIMESNAFSHNCCAATATLVGVMGATFTFFNKCDYTVWPGILANAGSPPLDSTGFELPKDTSRAFQAPTGWSGRFWGRTGCTFDGSGAGSCLTGDCGSGQVECNGAGAAPPATLAEFTLGTGGQDFYDVSLVDGYNLPMIVEGTGGSGLCASTGCTSDLNQQCPAELRASEGSACKSACEAFGSPEYCCSGAYGSPATCRPSIYSEMFKAACPRSYSYAYDDATSTFTCSGADYTVTFCPSSPSQKSSRDTTTNPMTSTTTSPGSGTVTGTGTGTGSEGAVVYTGADNGVAYNTVTDSGSSSGSGGETMLADGSYLAGLAMGDSPERTVSIAFVYSASFLLILFLL
ncbi:hypothetical protein JHK87_032607 [Glycine soja]|nr:hypothetical protein JHK87_032607 [Glycine soja]